jgi:hypothetical protein
MSSWLRQSMAVIAVAAVLAYMGLISFSHVSGYVAWPVDMLALSVVAALCGALLALAEGKSILLLVIASAMSVFLFGGFWMFASWALLGNQFSFVELILSDIVFVYIVQRSFVLAAPGFVFGVLGAIIVELFLPKILRR